MCKILSFYSIISDVCPNSGVTTTVDNVKVDNVSWSNRWKIVLIVLWVIVWIFVILVIIFAVRAKMNQEDELEKVEQANEEENS